MTYSTTLFHDDELFSALTMLTISVLWRLLLGTMFWLRNLTWGLQHAEWSLLLYQLTQDKCHQCVGSIDECLNLNIDICKWPHPLETMLGNKALWRKNGGHRWHRFPLPLDILGVRCKIWTWCCMRLWQKKIVSRIPGSTIFYLPFVSYILEVAKTQ